jgi:hypothetical protein
LGSLVHTRRTDYRRSRWPDIELRPFGQPITPLEADRMNSPKVGFAVPFVALAFCSYSHEARAAATFFGPTPYLSTADIPAGFYAGGSPAFLEDFEDNALNGGITATPALGGGGAFFGSDFGTALIDSVDADDGLINGVSNNGAGHFGQSYWTPSTVTFTFSGPLPTAAALVWTDGATSGEKVTFEAFGPGSVSLGTYGPFPIGDGDNFGGTAEDRFFGVQNPGGILAISLTPLIGALEVDHVQYGVGAPEPSTLLLSLLVGLTLALRAARQQR